MTRNTFTITAQDLWRREGGYCLSHIVATLAGGWTGGECLHGFARGEAFDRTKAREDLCEQAFELACPIDDYEESARAAGWQEGSDRFPFARRKSVAESAADADSDEVGISPCVYADSWREACEIDGVEPYGREVFEHWIVSSWLAERLQAAGEKVDTDFGGLCVWARTTTGQAVYADRVIEQIAADLSKGGEG